MYKLQRYLKKEAELNLPLTFKKGLLEGKSASNRNLNINLLIMSIAKKKNLRNMNSF